MKKIFNWLFAHSGQVVSALALLIATSSVGTTCVAHAYQPEVPEELQDAE